MINEGDEVTLIDDEKELTSFGIPDYLAYEDVQIISQLSDDEYQIEVYDEDEGEDYYFNIKIWHIQGHEHKNPNYVEKNWKKRLER